MTTDRIYLDHAATTPIDRTVATAITQVLAHIPGNPSSLYREGRAARDVLDRARAKVATTLVVDPNEIVFTSSGSEGATLAIRGAAFAAAQAGRRHLVTTAIEHHAVLHTVQHLVQRHSFEATIVGVDQEGRVDPSSVIDAVRDDTAIVSVMYANNEIGSIQPIARIAAELRDHPALFHSDAVQGPGHLPIAIPILGVDLLSLAAHKFYGPKGIGALYIRDGTRLSPQIVGGTQERGRRAGTENVAFAEGMAVALHQAESSRTHDTAHNLALRDALIKGITSIAGSRLNGPMADRLPNNVNVVFEGVDSEALLLALDSAGVSASSGSACTSASLEPSHVLHAIGLKPDLAASSLRLTTGRENTASQISRTIEILHDLVPHLRGTAMEKPGQVT